VIFGRTSEVLLATTIFSRTGTVARSPEGARLRPVYGTPDVGPIGPDRVARAGLEPATQRL
jgi:hypothetical protein